jgi:hypothetical protein
MASLSVQDLFTQLPQWLPTPSCHARYHHVPGVYVIIGRKASGEAALYFGSTVNLYDRLYNHLKALAKGRCAWICGRKEELKKMRASNERFQYVHEVLSDPAWNVSIHVVGTAFGMDSWWLCFIEAVVIIMAQSMVKKTHKYLRSNIVTAVSALEDERIIYCDINV